MLFSSTVFLFAFLPIVLTAHLLLRDVRLRNALLLAASLVFYAWGEAIYVLLLVFSIAANWSFGLWVERSRGRRGDRIALSVAIAANLLLLAVFKYANFVVDNLDLLLVALDLTPLALAPVHLPIGISFFTFQSLTYVVDIHRRDASVQRNPLRVALYISFFPQLIAGPIVRYRQIAEQLSARSPGIEDVADGLRRFVVGLGKKVLIANTLAVPADAIFAIPIAELEPGVAWLGIACFSLQIYFDFAGYSDMAIGLGRCFGFAFPENFDWPYTSRSLREFWRRWHMTLSTFFRDYLYIPMGGNRMGAKRTAANLLTVFVLCGLWHGAAWVFVIWGLVHGFFLALERTRFGHELERAPAFVQHTYVLIVVMIAWVFFRADDLAHALGYLAAMAGRQAEPGGAWPFVLVIDPLIASALAGGAFAALPVARRLGEWSARLFEAPPLPLDVARLVALGLVGLLCAMSLAAGTHNPFIYFRF